MQSIWAFLHDLWSWLNLPPVGNETALHIDLATAFIALLALVFSIWSWRHQTRISIEAMRIERDNDLIRWIDAVIDTIVEIEFFLRGWAASVDPHQLSVQRDGHLAKVAAAIDKGRLYFPSFNRDVVVAEGEPPSPKFGLPLLDDLAEIYDLAKSIDLGSEPAVKEGRQELMKKKRHFVISAQNEIEPDRRLLSARRRYARSSQGSHR